MAEQNHIPFLFVNKDGIKESVIGMEKLYNKLLLYKTDYDNPNTMTEFIVFPIEVKDVSRVRKEKETQEWIYPKSDPDHPWSCAKDCKRPDTEAGCSGCPLA